MKVHFINVGYGDSILIEFPDHRTMLIDAGLKEYSSKVVDYIKEVGVGKIDSIILTHPHSDHFEGFVNVVDAFAIDNFYYNGDERNPHEGYGDVIKKIKKAGLIPKKISGGTELYTDMKDVYIKLLHPPMVFEGSTNENSMAFLIRYKKKAILLMSDIQPRQQDRIIEMFPEIIAADCIQIPHHGGKLSDNFIELAGEKVLIMSTGENKYGKPFEKEIAKIKGQVYRTDRHGTIVVESNGYNLKVSHE